jgi:hypothetical protein
MNYPIRLLFKTILTGARVGQEIKLLSHVDMTVNIPLILAFSLQGRRNFLPPLP